MACPYRMLKVVEPERHWIQTLDGWELEAKNYRANCDPSRPPVMFIPGFCMNTFPLAYHPRGVSMVEYLVAQGLNVWTVNLRGQGDSRAGRHAGLVGFAEISLRDLPLARAYVAEHSGHDQVDVVGCSLGGTFVFAYLAHNPQAAGVRKVVGLGAPLTWVQRSLLMRATTMAPSLLAAIPLRGTRRIAKHVLPIAKRVPGLLSMYMNTSRIDLSSTDELVQTVDDPHPRLNGQVARWVKDRELHVDGLNISRSMSQVQNPYLGIYGSRDGIVFPAVAVAAAQAFGGEVDLLCAGHEDNEFGHADLFINDEAESQVFQPLADWLLKP